MFGFDRKFFVFLIEVTVLTTLVSGGPKHPDYIGHVSGSDCTFLVFGHPDSFSVVRVSVSCLDDTRVSHLGTRCLLIRVQNIGSPCKERPKVWTNPGHWRNREGKKKRKTLILRISYKQGGTVKTSSIEQKIKVSKCLLITETRFYLIWGSEWVWTKSTEILCSILWKFWLL